MLKLRSNVHKCVDFGRKYTAPIRDSGFVFCSQVQFSYQMVLYTTECYLNLTFLHAYLRDKVFVINDGITDNFDPYGLHL